MKKIWFLIMIGYYLIDENNNDNMGISTIDAISCITDETLYIGKKKHKK